MSLKSLLPTSFTSTFRAATITMLLALITNSLIYKKNQNMMFTPVLLKKRTNRIGNTETETETETQQPWFSQFQSYTITIRYSIQLVAKEKKRQYTKTLLLIYYYYGEKRNQKTKMLWQFFSPKNQKIESKTR